MKGLILINAFYADEEYLYQPKRLKEEFTALGVDVDILRNDFFPYVIDGGDVVSALKDYDFCIFYDKDKYILQAVEKSGIPTFNSQAAILACDDKMTTYLTLANHGVPMPKTLPGLLCFLPSSPVPESVIDGVENELSYPLIVKESYGSRGKEVYLANNRNELENILEKVKCKPHLIQQFITSSHGRDLRVIVIGGKVVGGMLRRSHGDFRSNLCAGGDGEAYELDGETVKLAQKISEILSLDYCGIDLLFGDNGMIVCEVNSNAFFYGYEKCTGINVARLYAEHVLRKVQRD